MKFSHSFYLNRIYADDFCDFCHGNYQLFLLSRINNLSMTNEKYIIKDIIKVNFDFVKEEVDINVNKFSNYFFAWFIDGKYI